MTSALYKTSHLKDTLIDKVKKIITTSAQKAFPQLSLEQASLEVTKSTQENFGHYQCNGAMKLASPLKLSPRKIAEEIIKHIPENDSIARVEIAGPGFINIWIRPELLSQKVETILHDPALGVHVEQKLKIVIDFSSPNTAKEMHVGHLRSTIIGDSLARLFEFFGHTVLRLNHVGDWGTQFGMLITFMKEKAQHELQHVNEVSLQQLVSFYKQSKMLFDEDENFRKRSQKEVVALQSGEKEAVSIWEKICAISRKAYQEIYDLLGVHIIERGESFYNPQLGFIVTDLEKRGLVTISDGAKCIFLDGFLNREGEPLPLMIQKSDGGYNYDTTDMAAIYHRIHDEHADRIIYVTDSGQATHFQMVFQAAQKAGYLDPIKVQADHVPFGLVLGADGKKFRTRSGETERLIDLITTAIDRADVIMKERNPDFADQERKQIAKALGISAIKYADLSCNRVSDYSFSYERMLKFDGNTAAFIMYSYVRVLGIKRKVGIDPQTIKEKILLEHPSEIALGLHLVRFPEVLEQMAIDLLPNRLTDYLFELAERFNAFFRDCRVEGSPEQNRRLLLVEAVGRTLQKGLHILGVEVVERM